MSPSFNTHPLVRGACPGISTPMMTGDGLLARLNVDEPIPIAAFMSLCAAIQRHGNGTMEISRRGSLQFRGLSASSAPAFASEIVAIDLGRYSGPQIVTSPLLGLDASEPGDLRPLVENLKRMLSLQGDCLSLAPKFSILIDGGGTLSVNDVRADIRLRAIDPSQIYLSMAGTATSAVHLGSVDTHFTADIVQTILTFIVESRAGARAKDDTHPHRLDKLRDLLFPHLKGQDAPAIEPGSEAIGVLPLNNGRFALGFALPFGFASANQLQTMALTAADCGASHFRPAPGRVLLAIGMLREGADRLLAAALDQGMIVNATDKRRFIVACAGAPACRSALMSTRDLASRIADALGSSLDGSFTIHLSGCEKGCAHSGVTAFTITGPDRVVIQGRAGDFPQGFVAPEKLIDGMRNTLNSLRVDRQADEPMAHLISRVGSARILALMGAATRHG